jgi:Protein of unknown function (DUF2752)
MNSDKRIYWILTLLTIGSYVWIGYHLSHTESQPTGTLCLFKTATGIPCPSCGITRSLLLILQGDVSGAFWINPLGILAAMLLIIIPAWVIVDLSRKKYLMLLVYKRSEEIIRSKKFVYIPLIALVALNWIWNISKGI